MKNQHTEAPIQMTTRNRLNIAFPSFLFETSFVKKLQQGSSPLPLESLPVSADLHVRI
jgi:hypothetical protein